MEFLLLIKEPLPDAVLLYRSKLATHHPFVGANGHSPLPNLQRSQIKLILQPTIAVLKLRLRVLETRCPNVLVVTNLSNPRRSPVPSAAHPLKPTVIQEFRFFEQPGKNRFVQPACITRTIAARFPSVPMQWNVPFIAIGQNKRLQTLNQDTAVASYLRCGSSETSLASASGPAFD